MAAGTAIATMAATQSAIAAAEAHAARVTACRKYMPGYTHDTASVEQQREYAGCVGVLQPSELPAGAEWVIKAAIVIVLVCMGIGAWKGDGYGRPTIGDRVMASVMWAIASAAAMFGLALIAAGVIYVIH